MSSSARQEAPSGSADDRLVVGSLVTYPPHGVGLIAARENRIVLGAEAEVVVVELSNELSVVLPLDRARELLRAPLSEAELRDVGETLRGAGVSRGDEAWPKRLDRMKEKLLRGGAVEVAEVVRDAVRHQETRSASGSQAKLSTSERALYQQARRNLSGEIALASGMAEEEADAWIDEQLTGTDG
jgi:CarD family transcriptional regulator